MYSDHLISSGYSFLSMVFVVFYVPVIDAFTMNIQHLFTSTEQPGFFPDPRSTSATQTHTVSGLPHRTRPLCAYAWQATIAIYPHNTDHAGLPLLSGCKWRRWHGGLWYLCWCRFDGRGRSRILECHLLFSHSRISLNVWSVDNIGVHTWLQITRSPCLTTHPSGLNAPVTPQGNCHQVASIHHFQATICGSHYIHCNENCQVLDVFNMGVCIGINMRIKTT